MTAALRALTQIFDRQSRPSRQVITSLLQKL